ncbi:urease accessory protein UreD [Halorhabdus sp. BNX81]|uniref:urease accessory protein UreD n=1 Tax=Halorhabdus sp. BNX81 TaxID=2980181 RepID=UPI0023DCF7F7|nr:urease accessory protein UreD [Halorhabdus sp. BNX81]WEL22255.1 Urease accessory protein UreD [Halorhabdus sp. BNX81]
MAADVPRGFEQYAGEAVPQAAVGSPGKDGRLELLFGTDADSGTVLQRDFARVPFHVSGTLDHAPPADGTAVYVQSPTGGVAQGDRHDVSIRARQGATALVSTQSATKVQSMTHNFARAEIEVAAGDGTHLEYVPGATILYPDARYTQSLTIELGSAATAIVGEVIVPGRLARGEAFEFDRYAAGVEASGPDGRLFADRLTLSPGDDGAGPRTTGVLSGDVFGTLYAVTTTECPAASLADAMADRVADCDPEAGVSTLPNDAGSWVRVVGDSTESVTDTLHAAWDGARQRLLGVPAPALRKY